MRLVITPNIRSGISLRAEHTQLPEAGTWPDTRVKPNSHQTIFLTDFQRRTKIEKSVVVGRFIFENR